MIQHHILRTYTAHAWTHTHTRARARAHAHMHTATHTRARMQAHIDTRTHTQTFDQLHLRLCQLRCTEEHQPPCPHACPLVLHILHNKLSRVLRVALLLHCPVSKVISQGEDRPLGRRGREKQERRRGRGRGEEGERRGEEGMPLLHNYVAPS